MKISDLDPKYLTTNGERRGFVFRCPHCRAQTWLTCFFQPTPMYHDADGKLFGEGTQSGMIRAALPDKADRANTIMCDKDTGWSHSGDTFDTLTVAPSLDFSAAGHWHGFIQGGHIVGGVAP